ncbi:MAG: pilus assembly protein PilM [Candidatus Aceula lacicola]|nr:pilus assembly protein PilM [Candidatus Aceula lacicola]
MAKQKKHIGVFFGVDSLSFVQTENNELTYSESIPHTFSPLRKQADEQQSPESIRLTEAIQKIIREQGILKPEINLSLPIRNVIFRAFTVPSMSASELSNAVLFEARKYIPFKLSDLVYGFHHIPITENGNKKTQILFIAMRKVILDQYCSIFEKGQIKIISAEPSSISLLRILMLQKQIENNQKIAIIQVNNGDGAITITEQQVPQFIRDFKLTNSENEGTAEESQKTFAQLFDEIKVSLDFYARQSKKKGNKHNIEKIFIFSDHYSQEIAEQLKSDIGVSAIAFDTRNLFGKNDKLNLNILNAAGTSITEELSLNLNLDLAKARNPDAYSAGADLDSFVNRPPNYKRTINIAGICGLIIAIAFIGSSALGLPQSSKIKTLVDANKKYENTSTSELKTKSKEIAKRVNIYKGVRFHSDVAEILSVISDQTPTGIWLKNFNIKYLDHSATKDKEKKEIEISLEGYGYADNLNNQITLIDAFIEKLKISKDLKGRLKHLELETVSKMEKDGFPVTYFQILIKLESQDNVRS